MSLRVIEAQPFLERCSTKISNWLGAIMFDGGHEIKLSFSANPLVAGSEKLQHRMKLEMEFVSQDLILNSKQMQSFLVL